MVLRVSVILLGLAFGPAVAGEDGRMILSAKKWLAWRGYEVGLADPALDPQTLAAVAAYRADWGLPAGGFDRALYAHLSGRHPATRQRRIRALGDLCVLAERMPRARERVTLDGRCHAPGRPGEGRLEWVWLHEGRLVRRVYEGPFVGERPLGPGRLTDSRWGVYEGEFRLGAMTGEGVLLGRDGTRHEGFFRDGRPEGRGRATAPDGSWREGWFTAGRIEGPGVAGWPDGRRYTGPFVAGEMHGAGILTRPDGTGLRVTFDRGVIAGVPVPLAGD